MSHPLVGILDAIQDEFDDSLAGCITVTDVRVERMREFLMVAAFEARDLAVAKAVQEECEFAVYMEREDIRVLDLKEIIKGVK